MSDCDSNSNHCLLNNSHHPLHYCPPTSRSAGQSKNSSLSSTTIVGLVPSSNAEQRELVAVSSLSTGSKSVSTPVAGGCERDSGGVVGSNTSGESGDGPSSLLIPDRSSGRNYCDNHSYNSDQSEKKSRACLNKMLTCRVLVVLLLVKCLILSFIIPAHLIPTPETEYPAPDYPDNAIAVNGDSHQSAGDEDGFENNIMLDDQPLSLTLKTEIMNLVEPFDILSQPVTAAEADGADTNGVPDPDNGANGNGESTDAPEGDTNGGGNGNDGGDGGDDDDNTTAAPAEESSGGER